MDGLSIEPLSGARCHATRQLVKGLQFKGMQEFEKSVGSAHFLGPRKARKGCPLVAKIWESFGI